MWTAARINFDTANRNNVVFRVIGRLKPGVSVEQAQMQVDRIAADLRQHFAIKQTAGLYFHVIPMFDDLVGDVRPTIVSLMGAVAFVLLIACANVANLLVVRASARSRELAVRAAIGASRGQLVRQMLAESLVIAALGTGAGPAARARRHPGAARARSEGSAAPRRGRDGSGGARVRRARRRGDGDRLRDRPGAARVAHRRDGGAALGRRPLGRAPRRTPSAQRVVVTEVALSFILLSARGSCSAACVALGRGEPRVTIRTTC